MDQRKGCVYGIYDHEAGLLKIGHTTRPDYRYRMFGVGRDDNVRLLFALEAPGHLLRPLERLLHECVANAREVSPHLKSPTEWFRVTLANAQTIGRIATDFVALLSDEPESHRGAVITAAMRAAQYARARAAKAN